MHAAHDSAANGMPSSEQGTPKRHLGFRGKAPRTRSVLLATGLLTVGIAPFGIAATGDALREGKRNGTTRAETEIVGNFGSSKGLKGGYVTRQSNLSSSGGGAVYGCRSQAGGSGATPTPQNPCIRANNLSRGLAFEFNSSNGAIVGAITAAAGGDTKKPFVTNATGVATGLNADRVDNLDVTQIIAAARTKAGLDADTVDGASASDLRTRWALVDEKGVIAAQSGGFTILEAYGTDSNVYINAGEELADNGINATIAIQDQVDVNNAAGADANFQGEISVARCQIPNVIECSPASAKNTQAFVVSPRNSDGSATTPTTRKRFYISISE